MTSVHYKILAASAVLFASSAGSSLAATSVPDWNMPGIPEAGFPHFQDAVKVSFAKNGSNWKLTATQANGTHLFQLDPDSSYNVTSASYSLTANFDRRLNFTSGNLKIDGKVPGMGVNRSTTLWKTSLTDFGVDFNPLDGSPIALGFETSGHSGWATRFSSGAPESVYLFSPNLSTLALNLFGHKGISASINATSITTVPVPAAVWLFGSALAGMVGFSRRKSMAAEGSPA